MIKIVGDIDISGIKRCYIKGTQIGLRCPTCGEMMIHDFGDTYLMYPRVGTKDIAIFSCEPCSESGNYTEWELPLSIISAKIEIEYDPKDLRKW